MQEDKKKNSFNISSLKTDKFKQEEGIWFDTPFKNLRVKVAHIEKIEYQEYLYRLMKPHRRQISRGLADLKATDDKIAQAVAEHLLLDWENLTEDINGVETITPYSKKKALEYLQEYSEFREIILEYANDAESFRARDLEEAQGNSEAA